MELTQEQQELMTLMKESPRFFIEEILGGELDPQQIPIIEAFKKSRRVAIKSGHSCGKDWIAARLGLWFHCAHYPSIVITTGPTDRQVVSIVWGEIRKAYKNSKIPIGGNLLPEAAMLKSGDPAHYMMGFVGKTPEAFQGFHEANVLIIVTEAQGIEARVWESINSLMTAGNAKLLAIGNPTYEPDSEFYTMFSSKAELFQQFTLDSRESAYCSDEWVQEVIDIYGEDSPYYEVRVKGEFPKNIADTLIPIGWIEKAKERAGELGVKTLGVDVARFGSDLTVFVLGDGQKFRVIHWVQGADLMETTGHVKKAIKEHNIKPEHVRIDDTGLGGGVTDRLKELNLRITPINFGSASSDQEKYTSARDEMFWELRERFRGMDIDLDPRDGKMQRDLSVLKYKLTSKSQIKLEPKAEAKKRLGQSPDRADALALAALPQHIASTIAKTAVSHQGLLDWMREEANKVKTAREKGDEPINTRPMTDVPGATEILGRGKEHGQSFDKWQSVIKP